MDIFEIPKQILSLLQDRSMKNITKFFVVLFIVLSIIALDNYLGVSYYSNIDNKLTQLKNVNDLLDHPSLDNKTKVYLLNVKKDILERQTFIDKIQYSFGRISFTSSKNEIVNELNKSIILRNSIIEFVSINYFCIFLFIGLPFYFFINRFSLNFWHNLLLVIAVEAFLIILSFTLFFLFSLIPTILGRPYLNYILNFLLFFILISVNTVRLNKKNNS